MSQDDDDDPRQLPLPICLVLGLLVLLFGAGIGRQVVIALGGPAAEQEIERKRANVERAKAAAPVNR